MNQRIENSDFSKLHETGFQSSFAATGNVVTRPFESAAASRLSAGAAVEPPESGATENQAIDLDSEFARQTKAQIRQVIVEITHLARQSIDPANYFSSLVVKICQAMNATGAAIWCYSPDKNARSNRTSNEQQPPAEKSQSEWHLLADYRVPDALVGGQHNSDDPGSLLNNADVDHAAELVGNESKDDQPQSQHADLDRYSSSLEGQLEQLQKKVECALENFDQLAAPPVEDTNTTDSSTIRRVASPPSNMDKSSESEFAPRRLNIGDLPDPLSEPFAVSPVIEPSGQLLPILQAVSSERQPVLVPPGGTRLKTDRPENPLDEFLIHAPIPFDSVHGQLWIQVVQPASGGPTTQRGFLRFVAQVADLASEFLRVHRLRLLDEQQRQIETTDQLLANVPLMDNPAARIRAVVDAVASIARADHLFLLRRRPVDKKWRVEAAADLKRIKSNSEAIEALSSCANRWLKQNRSEKFPDVQIFPPGESSHQFEGDWSHLVDSFGGERIAIFPVDNYNSSHLTVGDCYVMTVAIWGASDNEPTPKVNSSHLPTSPISAPQLFRMISALRQGLSISQVNWWQKTIHRNSMLNSTANPLNWRRSAQAFVAGCIVACVGLLPVPLTVHSSGTLHPAQPARSYATTSGVVNEIYVKHGDSVTIGQPLLLIESQELNDRYDNLIGQQQSAEEQLAEIESQLLRSDELTLPQRDRFESEALLLRDTIAIRGQQINSLISQIDRLTIRASIDGVVNSWDIQQRLANLPVAPGQLLLSLHAPESDWIIETKVAERDISEIRNWISSGDRDEPATAEFFLTAYPTETVRGVFDSVDANLINEPADGATPVDEAYWRLKLRTPAVSLPQHIDGAVARVQFSNGTAPLAWALTRDFFLSAYTQFKMWL